MTIWSGEIKELDKLYQSFKGQLPDVVKEMEQLIKTQDPNVVMLYSRRCLEVIITDLCETELKRPRKTEPLKGIIDKLNSEEKVPSHIVASMQSLNSMSTYGTHPKDFDPEQVKPVLNNLAIVIKWYMRYKDFQIVSKTESENKKLEPEDQYNAVNKTRKPKKRISLLLSMLFVVILIVIIISSLLSKRDWENAQKYSSIDAYKRIVIGNQTWLAENLKTTIFNDGMPIPLVKKNDEWTKLKSPAYCWYDNNKSKYGDTYGALYNWYAVNTGKLCPTGWHVPSEKEWKTLTDFLGDTILWTEVGDSISLVRQVAGDMLKEAGDTHWRLSDSTSPSNKYGFTALPGGIRNVYGPFYDIGEASAWWSSTEEERYKEDAMNREMRYNETGVTEIQQYKQFGMSVRCLKDSV